MNGEGRWGTELTFSGLLLGFLSSTRSVLSITTQGSEIPTLGVGSFHGDDEGGGDRDIDVNGLGYVNEEVMDAMMPEQWSR